MTDAPSSVTLPINSVEIERLLPHRYPFLLVDRVVEFEKDKRVLAYKNVTCNEPFFTGHFPGHPVMPGVLVVEALAQAGGLLAVDAGDAHVLRHVADASLELDLQLQAVAGDDHAAEPRVVHLHQVEGVLAQLRRVARQLGEQAAGLRQRFDHQHARHHRVAREMAGEERLVAGHVLVGQHALVLLELDHPVDQQEGIAVREQALDLRRGHRQGHARGCIGHAGSLSLAPARGFARAMRSSCLKRAALLRQLRLSINGVPEEYSPGSRIEWVTSDIAVMTTRSQTSRWPRMPAPPPTRQ